MAYLLDSDALITAKNGPYAFELCPGFWAWLDVAPSSRKVRSVQAVLDELIVQEDELAQWARSRERFFLPPDPGPGERLGVSLWVYDPGSESLTNWASADRVWRDPKTMEPLQVDWRSEFVSVQAFAQVAWFRGRRSGTQRPGGTMS